MKVEFDEDDLAAIASAVANHLRGLILAPRKGSPPDEVMDVKAVASYLMVKPSWVYKQVEYKAIPHFHAGRYPRFRRKDIEAWVNSRAVPATAPPYPDLKKGTAKRAKL